jgi:hypothetical protein
VSLAHAWRQTGSASRDAQNGRAAGAEVETAAPPRKQQPRRLASSGRRSIELDVSEQRPTRGARTGWLLLSHGCGRLRPCPPHISAKCGAKPLSHRRTRRALGEVSIGGHGMRR